jgi:hypothetical protein
VAATAGIKAKKESTNLDVQRAEAAEALAKESMLGIGFSAQAAKNTFEQKNEAAKLATQEHQIVVAKREEARAALASATTEEQKQKAQAKFDVASKESKKTEIDMMNKQKDVMASLNKLREGYLDILGDAVFGIGEMSIIAQSDSGMANMGPGSARYGGRGQGRMGPAATMTATGGMWMPGEQSSGSIGYNTMTAWVGGLQASGQAGYALGRAAGALQQTQFGYGAVTVNVGGSAPVNVPAMF